MRTSVTAKIGQLVLCGALVVVGASAEAQSRRPLGVFAAVNIAQQTATSDFSAATTFPMNEEEADLAASFDVPGSIVFDVSGGYRLGRQLGVGIGFTRTSSSGDVDVEASLPHPFHFNQHRAVSGTETGIDRTETGIHIQASWFVPINPRYEVRLFGGPTIFSITQELPTDVSFTSTFPFDTAEFTGLHTEEETGSTVGFHVGGEFTYHLHPQVGVGATATFTRGSSDLVNSEGASFAVTFGGFQIGGGARFRF